MEIEIDNITYLLTIEDGQVAAAEDWHGNEVSPHMYDVLCERYADLITNDLASIEYRNEKEA